ncbi:MAG: hypothetical protein A4E48_00125 [Methanosaeta sp. PtaU1.Bin060]|nr:MAG: hypothetical protein A4E48_00125 [Methanosaeta sp. PtaU1.Bin060]
MSELEECRKALEEIAKSYVEKSAGQSAKAAQAVAIAKATRTPQGAALARRIIQLERQQVAQAQFEPVLKALGPSENVAEADDGEWVPVENDDWPCYGTCRVRRR